MKDKKVIIVVVLIIVSMFLLNNYLKRSNDVISVTNFFPSSNTEHNDYWSYLEWKESFPEQNTLIEAFDSLIQERGKREFIPGNKLVKIAIVYPAVQKSDYWIRNVNAFEIRLEELGIDFQIEKYFSKPGEIHLQHDQILSVVNSDYDYLITSVDEFADLNLIERILAEGKIKVILQNITTPLKRFGNKQPLLYAGFDHEQGSVLLAQRIKERFPDKLNWILLLFTDGIVSKQRGGAFQKEMNENANLLSIYKTEGNREKAKMAVLDALDSYENIDFFYSCATDVTLGALDALKEKQLSNKYILNGWGGGNLELELIINNDLDLTVMRMNDDTGIAMAEAIRLDLQDKADLIPVVYSGRFILIDKTLNRQEELIKNIENLKFNAFRYSSRGAIND